MTWNDDRTTKTLLMTLLLVSTAACRSVPPVETTDCPLPVWNLDDAEIKVWSATDPEFAQDRALEGSGLVAAGDVLYATSEKYHRLLKINRKSLEVEVLELGVPAYSELEGVTLMDGEALLCDEAHAAVFAVDLGSTGRGGPLASSQLIMEGIGVRGGKIGLEGITALDDGSRMLYLLLERGGDEESGCMSTVFAMRRDGERLEVAGAPLRIALEDCNWRLTALQWWNGWLVALKTRYPGERYEVVAVDTVTGELTKVLDLTELLMAAEREGWGNNVEGLTITPDGALWLLSDNALTGVVDDPAPPLAKDRTLLLRIPAVRGGCVE